MTFGRPIVRLFSPLLDEEQPQGSSVRVAQRCSAAPRQYSRRKDAARPCIVGVSAGELELVPSGVTPAGSTPCSRSRSLWRRRAECDESHNSESLCFEKTRSNLQAIPSLLRLYAETIGESLFFKTRNNWTIRRHGRRARSWLSSTTVARHLVPTLVGWRGADPQGMRGVIPRIFFDDFWSILGENVLVLKDRILSNT